MGITVKAEQCTGCGRCVDICPGDLLALLPQEGKAYLRSARDCWGCMSCVKSCPEGALERRLPFSLAGYGASLRPKVHETHIVWTLRYPNGEVEEFAVKTREQPGRA